MANRTASAWGINAVGIFLFFGAVIASLAGITLAWPHSALDRIWVLNRRAYAGLAPFGRAVGIPFLVLSVVLAIVAVGWFKRRLWGWWLAVAIVAAQVLGDLLNLILGRVLEGGMGVAIAGGLLCYLVRARVKAAFVTNDALTPN